MSTIKYIQSDLYRYYGKNDFFTLIYAYLKNRTIRWHVAFRTAQSSNRFVRLCGKILLFFNHTKKDIQIHFHTDVGYGLYIGHNGPIVVNSTAKIGNNVNLSQFTTIGSNNNNAANIGDNVYIGPGVNIIENVKIGNNVTIGAGSVITKDIPDNATAAGNYAKVLNYDNPGRFINRRYLHEDQI